MKVAVAACEILACLYFQPPKFVIAIFVLALVVLEHDNFLNRLEWQPLCQRAKLTHERACFLDVGAFGGQRIVDGQTHDGPLV